MAKVEKKSGSLLKKILWGVLGLVVVLFLAALIAPMFVPWEKVFMCGETEFSGLLVERFACYHRQNYGGCKGGVSDIVIGAAAVTVEAMTAVVPVETVAAAATGRAGEGATAAWT